MHGTSALYFIGKQRTPPFQKWMQLLLNVYDCLTVTEFSGSQISCYIWQRINASQNIFHSLPPILNLFQNLSTPIARNSHYFYSEPMLWSTSYTSLYHIAVFISCQWFLPNPNVYIVEMRLSSSLIFKMLLKFLISLVFHEAYIYLFHFKIIFSEMCPLLLSRFYQSCLINTIFGLQWPCFFWANLGSHQAFHGYVTLLTHSHPVIYRFIQILVTLSLCWVPRHYQKFLLAPNSTTL